MRTTPSRVWIAFAVVGMLAADPAAAHHAMDSQLPATFAQGLLSGLGHPVIGVDHLAAILAVGALAALAGNGMPRVAAYVAAMLAGTAVHVGAWTIPGNEPLVALTVIMLGALLALAQPPSARVLVLIFVAAGLLHGYAMGESIVGAERTPLVAYFTGLAVVQTGLGIAAMMVVRRLAMRPGTMRLRVAGAAVALVGVAVLGAGVIA
jgi:urease accessory protein